MLHLKVREKGAAIKIKRICSLLVLMIMAQLFTATAVADVPNDVRDVYGSSFYNVSIREAGSSSWQDVFVYRNENPRQNFRDTSLANHWASFDFDFSKAIEVRVMTVGDSIDNGFSVVPKSDKVSANRIDSATIQFSLEHEGQYWVKIPNLDKEPLFIFANPKEVNALKPGGENVIEVKPGADYQNVFSKVKGMPESSEPVLYFTPGMHYVGDVNDALKKHNLTLYLPEHSVLVASFEDYGLNNFAIRGRGTLTGGHPNINWPSSHDGFPKPSNIDSPGGEHRDLTNFKASGKDKNMLLDGIVMISTRGFLVRNFTRDAIYNNLKLFGWYPNTDGFSVYRNAACTNNFVKVNDDAYKLATDGVVDNNVIWHQYNAHVFVSRIWSGGETDNIRVSNTDIIRKEVGYGGAIFAYRGFRDGNYHGYTFENIHIDSDVDRLIHFAPTREYFNEKNFSVKTPEPGTGGSDLYDFVFKNITWEGKETGGNSGFFAGYTGRMYDITFDNVVLNGKTATSLRDFNKRNGFTGFYGMGDIKRIKFIANGVESSHDDPAVEFNAAELQTDLGPIPIWGNDVKLPGGSVASVPGKFEAEAYNAKSGSIRENGCNDNSGACLGYVKNNDSVDYRILVSNAGDYTLSFRAASVSGGAIKVFIDGTLATTTNIVNTGGWDQFKNTLSETINLTEGEHVLRLEANGSAKYLWDLDSFSLAPSQYEAENFSIKEGSIRKNKCNGSSAQCVAYVRNSNWVEYQIFVPHNGDYHFDFRTAAADGNGGSINVSIDGNQSTVTDIPTTGGWANFENIKSDSVTLTEGEHTLRLQATNAKSRYLWDLDYFRVNASQ